MFALSMTAEISPLQMLVENVLSKHQSVVIFGHVCKSIDAETLPFLFELFKCRLKDINGNVELFHLSIGMFKAIVMFVVDFFIACLVSEILT